MEDPAAALGPLDTSLAALEAAVAPILSRTRAQGLAGLGNVEKAKMDVLLAFAINNLVWVYLRARGIDPEEHDVTAELERIKTYYAKVRAAEAPESSSRSRIDVPAASRIIKHSLPSSRDTAALPASSAAATARAQAEEATATRANRFRFVAKEGEKLIPGQGADESESMDVDGDAEDAEAAAASLLDSVEAEIVADEVAQTVAAGKKGGKKKVDGGKGAAAAKKRKRTAA